MSSMPVQTDLARKLKLFRQENPKAYLRNVAADLGSSEAELLPLEEKTTRLQNVEGLFQELAALEKQTTITRNDFAVHELTGRITVETLDEKNIVLSIGQSKVNIHRDLIAVIYLVEKEGRNSVQLYDGYGDSVVKFFLKDAALEPFFQFKHGEEPLKTFKKPGATGIQIDIKTKLAQRATRKLIEGLAKTDQQISVQVSSFGCDQYFTGKIERVVDARGWFNILDPDFNLHLKEEKCTDVYLLNDQSISATDGHREIVKLYFDSGAIKDEALTQILRGEK